MNVPLGGGTVSTRRAGAEAKRAAHPPLDGDLEVCHVVEDELDHRLVLLLAEELDEGLRGERLASLERGEPVLRKAIVKVADHCEMERAASLTGGVERDMHERRRTRFARE